ncbi:hypothetical protein AA0119_g3382 [Alternaria tenuissima]|uniref:ribonuclease T1 n=1 Tax=Alternaria tenuissima TaxID=119927 RepID=A0ABY0GH98_9PLEO|nr:hypothetical protein AA0118_g9965 [Alternaria tenuissima]RYO05485.1 hypothetical protein AA0119_g3382 [Alternaria tenuissima]RYO12343.1 hypothetical protein AA0121_g9219 [Alternaria tenuissima]RYO63687.1 hypothetical protein AA0116_g3674 [Alternaria tenuissima]
MQIIAVLFASLATLAAANPLPLNPDSNKALVARADIVSVKCPTVNNAAEATYSVKEIEDAYNIAVGLLQPPPHYATGKPNSQGVRKQYPAYYGNYQNIPVPADCNVPDLIEWNEFPILRGKVPFGDDSNAGPDRVVFARRNNNQFTYCFTVYHQDNADGQGAGDFVQCT